METFPDLFFRPESQLVLPDHLRDGQVVFSAVLDQAVGGGEQITRRSSLLDPGILLDFVR